MVFDLGKAIRRRKAYVSCRLEDFACRRRVRATRKLAAEPGRDEAEAARRITALDDPVMLANLAEMTGEPRDALVVHHDRCLALAHAELLTGRGDPKPHRLA
jgi:hypothetical protein